MPDPLIGIPSQFEAGDTLIFTEQFADYAPGTYTAALILNNGVAAATTVAATTSGAAFLFTITAAVSAAYAAGDYTYAIYATSGSARYTAKTGTIKILPNLTATATPSFAQAQVTRWQATIAELSARKARERNFNGQQSLDQDIAEATKQLTYWRAAVARENAAALAARGVMPANRVTTQFISATA